MHTVYYYLKNELPSNIFGYYYKNGLFAQYVTNNKYTGYSNYNWKIHVNYPFYESLTVKKNYLFLVLSYLQSKDINHKIVIYEKDMERKINNQKKYNSQNGKIITIYCNSEIECYRTLCDLDLLIKSNKFINYYLFSEQQFRNDKIFNNNPYVGYRHSTTARKHYYLVPEDKYGIEIEDIQTKFKKLPMGEFLVNTFA